MRNSPRLRADEKFTSTHKKAKQARKNMEKARQDRLRQTARLRALRLAKEAADKEAARAAADKKSSARA